MVLDGYGNSLWSTNSPHLQGNSSSTATLMDTGNLILSGSECVGDQENAFWQSFNEPTDTFLPDMKVYIDVRSNGNGVFTSWKSETDPSMGKYSMGIDPRGSPQIVIWDGLNRHWRSGHWNGIIFTGVPTMRTLYSNGFKLIKESSRFYFTYALANASDLVRFRIRPDGIEEQLSENGVAEGESADGFLKIEGVKLPDFASLVMVEKIDECAQNCSRNCSCRAYAFVSGINCMVWSGDLVDMQRFVDGGNDLYIRVARSELGNRRKFSKLLIILLAVIGIFFVSATILILWRFKMKSKRRISGNRIPTIDLRSTENSTDFSGSNELGIEGQQRNGQELSLYSFSSVAAATNNFSEENKLGQGGFGPVYKGKLFGREEIAVKRLSRKSGQEMNPKISDFGMAKMFGKNESEASTNRVVGTYGYMAPEYAMEGLFSVKSDVYSFGILVLEIISGRRNSSFHSPEYSNIIGYAWDLWDGGRALELIDPSIKSSYSQNEVMRCVHVAMLCVQDSAAHRPNMSSVVLMLESENAKILPMPRQPTFTSMRRSTDLEVVKTGNDIPSANDLTISSIVGR
ncbi:hypothetical protein Vadar_018405 [Vaccinium darrowii]|uniref:Uncharacterized protein n=1 Tax=Vaccinium darrowii TaxID=229202 RepID=A0ACB7YYC7_9ERIC|nr:hypothetical protein Vadar_018405 [Vaccinium darrowii]